MQDVYVKFGSYLRLWMLLVSTYPAAVASADQHSLITGLHAQPGRLALRRGLGLSLPARPELADAHQLTESDAMTFLANHSRY